MQIKTKKDFNKLLKNLTFEVIKEMTVTGDVDGYMTPFAFTGKKGKKKNKKITKN